MTYFFIAEESLLPVPISTLRSNMPCPSAFFLKTGPGKYVLYRAKQTLLTTHALKRLESNGIDTLYAPKDEELAMFAYYESQIRAAIDGNMPRREACRILYESSSQILKAYFTNPRAELSIERVKLATEGTVAAVLKDTMNVWEMLMMAGHDYYTYRHCLSVSLFMVAAAKEIMNIDDPEKLEEVGLGGILHDIGKSRIPSQILKKPGKLTLEEFEEVKKHPQLGFDMIKKERSLTDQTFMIINSHHERYDGTGYLNGLSGDSISDLTRLSTIVDVYDALTSNRPYARARSPFKAARLMQTEMEGHFDDKLLKEFIRFLGPRGNNNETRKKQPRAEISAGPVFRPKPE